MFLGSTESVPEILLFNNIQVTTQNLRWQWGTHVLYLPQYCIFGLLIDEFNILEDTNSEKRREKKGYFQNGLLLKPAHDENAQSTSFSEGHGAQTNNL